MTTPSFQIGDNVRTIQQLHRLPARSIGTIVKVYGTNGLLGVLFPSERVPRFVYCEQLELFPPLEAE